MLLLKFNLTFVLYTTLNCVTIIFLIVIVKRVNYLPPLLESCYFMFYKIHDMFKARMTS